MTDKKDGPPKGPERGAAETPASKRPFATIDLKATEVKIDEVKAKAAEARTQTVGPAPAGTTGSTPAAPSQVDAAARTAAAAMAMSAKTARPAAGATAPVGADKAAPADMRAPWSVETALGDRGKPGDKDARAAVGRDAPDAMAVAAGARRGGAGGFFSHGAAGLLGGALAIFGAQQFTPMFGNAPDRSLQPGATTISPEIAGRLAGLERALRERLAAIEAPPPHPTVVAGLKRIEEMGRTIATLSETQTRLLAENAALKEAVARPPAAGADADRLAKLEEQLATIAAAATADPQRAGRIPQLAQLTGQVRDLEAALSTRLAALRKELAQDVDTRLAAAAEGAEAARSGTQRLDREVTGLKGDAARLTQRADQLKSGTEKVEQTVTALQREAAALKAALDGLKGSADQRWKDTAKPADIVAALGPIATRIGALEQAVQGVVRAEADRRSNAERIVLSLELGNLKRAMERGSPYKAELDEVRRIGGGQLDLKALEQYQSQGVPTLAALAEDFGKVANAVIDVAAEQPGASVMDRMLASAKTIVRVRRTDYAPGDTSVEAVVARMEAALKAGRLADVVAQARTLPEKARAPVQAWMRKVEARQAVDAALGTIDMALKSSLGAGPGPATPARSKP